MSERIRIMPMRSQRDDQRLGFPMLNARGPIRTFEQVAELTGMSYEQVRYCEECAFDKMRAALSAWGYHKEKP